MTTGVRARCTELVDIATAHCNPDDSAVGHCAAVLTRARAELAKPEPVAPTNKDLDALERKHWKLSSVVEYDSSEGFSEAFPKEETFDHRAYARAVLARWGTPTIQPVPVSERLPGADDCDAEGCCWAIGERGNWMDVHVIGRNWSNPIYTHWLPRWALPVPANTTKEEN